MSKLLTNMIMAVSETVSSMSEQVDTMEQRVNGMVEDMKDLKKSSLNQRDRVSRLEGEFNSARKSDVTINNEGSSAHAASTGGDNVNQGNQTFGSGDIE